ncbi:glycosyltransferase [Cytophagia bacterium CHB2]|nr:glycosyltransferase [Cytophagia bacterium CHB2]
MRILQVVQKPQRRGAEVFAFQLSQELKRQGHETRLVYLYPHEETCALPLAHSDRLLNGKPNHPFEKFPGINPFLLRRLLHAIDEFKPDVVQVNGARTVKYGAFASYSCRDASWALIYRNIGNPSDWLHGWHYRMFYQKLVMPRLHGVVGVSRKTLQAVKDFYGISVPIKNIPRAVDPASLVPTISRDTVRRQTKTPNDAPVLIFVGSLAPEKRLDRLLRLTQQVRLQMPKLHLWLIGSGPLQSTLRQQAHSLGIAESVRFLGVQSNVADYLNAADLFVLTSDTEGIPGVILEAGLLGLAVVATRVGGVPECVLDGDTGILVDRQDEQRLAEVVCDLLHDSARRHKLGARAKNWVGANFTIDKITGDYVEFYQQVLAFRHRLAPTIGALHRELA